MYNGRHTKDNHTTQEAYMKVNSRQKIIATIFAVVLLLVGVRSAIGIAGVIAIALSGALFWLALSD